MDRFAFLLNLADDGRPGRAPTTSTAARARVADAARRFAGSLVPHGSLSLLPDEAPPALHGLRGRAFVPHARARRWLSSHGACPDPAPDDEVLARVMRRSFAYVDELVGGRVTSGLDDTLAAIEALHARGIAARVKAAYGHAGRGQWVLRAAPTERTLRALRAEGPELVVEPEASIVRELSVHGFLARDGQLVVGTPCVLTTSRGVFVDASPLGGGEDPALAARLVREAEAVAETLAAARYFGPFGVDAYEHEAADGRRLRARSEVNARYTMAYALGMGASRPDLDPP